MAAATALARPRCRTSLVDISQTRPAAGLQEKLFQPGSEKGNGFYAELRRRSRSSWWAAIMTSAVSSAASPRCRASLAAARYPDHYRVDAKGGYDNLTMDVTAKTYRHIEDEGGAHPAKKKTGGSDEKNARNAGVICAALRGIDPGRLLGAANRTRGDGLPDNKNKPGGRNPGVAGSEALRNLCVQRTPTLRSPFPAAGRGFGQRTGQNLLPEPSRRANREFSRRFFARHPEKWLVLSRSGSSFYGLVQSKDGLLAKGAARQLVSGAERRQSDGTPWRENKLGRNHPRWSRRLYRATGLIGIVRLRPPARRKYD